MVRRGCRPKWQVGLLLVVGAAASALSPLMIGAADTIVANPTPAPYSPGPPPSDYYSGVIAPSGPTMWTPFGGQVYHYKSTAIGDCTTQTMATYTSSYGSSTTYPLWGRNVDWYSSGSISHSQGGQTTGCGGDYPPVIAQTDHCWLAYSDSQCSWGSAAPSNFGASGCSSTCNTINYPAADIEDAPMSVDAWDTGPYNSPGPSWDEGANTSDLWCTWFYPFDTTGASTMLFATGVQHTSSASTDIEPAHDALYVGSYDDWKTITYGVWDGIKGTAPMGKVNQWWFLCLAHDGRAGTLSVWLDGQKTGTTQGARKDQAYAAGPDGVQNPDGAGWVADLYFGGVLANGTHAHDGFHGVLWGFGHWKGWSAYYAQHDANNDENQNNTDPGTSSATEFPSQYWGCNYAGAVNPTLFCAGNSSFSYNVNTGVPKGFTFITMMYAWLQNAVTGGGYGPGSTPGGGACWPGMVQNGTVVSSCGTNGASGQCSDGSINNGIISGEAKFQFCYLTANLGDTSCGSASLGLDPTSWVPWAMCAAKQIATLVGNFGIGIGNAVIDLALPGAYVFTAIQGVWTMASTHAPFGYVAGVVSGFQSAFATPAGTAAIAIGQFHATPADLSGVLIPYRGLMTAVVYAVGAFGIFLMVKRDVAGGAGGASS